MCRCRMKGKLPKTVLGFALVSMIGEFFCLLVGMFRETRPGYNLYFYIREGDPGRFASIRGIQSQVVAAICALALSGYWHFWGVESTKITDWFDFASMQMQYYSRQNIMFAGCNSPICYGWMNSIDEDEQARRKEVERQEKRRRKIVRWKEVGIWYRLKSRKYATFAFVMYVSGGTAALGTLLLFRSLLWTTSFSPRELRFAFVGTFCGWWCWIFSLCIMDFAGFNVCFPQLTRESYYDEPPHSSGTLCCLIVWILTFIRLCMSGFLFAKSREFEQSETSSETEQDDEEEVAHAKAMFAKMKGKSPEAMKAKKKGNMMKKKGKGDDGIHAPGGGPW